MGDSELRCKHGRGDKKSCKTCRNYCEHGKSKSECRECGGRCLCVHGKRKTRCHICSEKGFCEHAILQIDCKICGGSRICIHNSIKKICKLCGGSGICIHGIKTYKCNTCKNGEPSAQVFPHLVQAPAPSFLQFGEPPAQVFPHLIQSSAPVFPHLVQSSAPVFPQFGEPPAPGFPQFGEPSAQVFPHLVQAPAPSFPHLIQSSAPVFPQFGEPSAPGFPQNVQFLKCDKKRKKQVEKKCEHNKRRSRCKICGGKDFCQHDRLRHECVKCHGSTICEHNKKRRNCRLCGTSICCHGKYKKWCTRCRNDFWKVLDIMNDVTKPNKIRIKIGSIIQAGLFHFCILEPHTVYACEITPGQTLPEISFTVDQKSVWTIPKYSIIILENGESACLQYDMSGYKVEIQHPFAQPFQDLDAFFGNDSDSKSDGFVMFDSDTGFDVSDSDSDSDFFRVLQGAQAQDDSREQDIWDI